MMHPDDRNQRLSAVVNNFSFQYSKAATAGALVQLWCPQKLAGGRLVLSTVGSPYAAMGTSDLLTLYKWVSSKYTPSCDGANEACAISRVFANLQPELSGDVGKKVHVEFDRVAEAQRCNIHSNLLLAIYDNTLPQPSPVAVFELAQHEVDVDFSRAVNILHDVAKEYGFWIPQLESARNVDSCEVPIEPLASASSTASTLSSMNTPLAAVLGHSSSKKARSCTPTPPCHQTAAVKRRSRGLRRSSCLVAEPPQPVPEEQSCEDQQQQQQQQQQKLLDDARALRQRRQSVIVTDHYQFDTSSGGRGRSRSRRASWGEEHLAPLAAYDGSTAGVAAAAAAAAATAALGGATSPCGADRKQYHHKSSSGRRSIDIGSVSRSSSRGSCFAGCNSRHLVDAVAAAGAGLRRAATPPLEPPNNAAYGRHEGAFTQSRFASNKGLAQQQRQQQQVVLQPPPPPQQPHWSSCAGPVTATTAAAAAATAASASRPSPFQCGAMPNIPHRSFTPAHHPHRHIVDVSHTARAASLQLQVLQGEDKQRQQLQQQHLWDHQQRDQQQPSLQRWRQPQHHLGQQQQQQQQQQQHAELPFLQHQFDGQQQQHHHQLDLRQRSAERRCSDDLGSSYNTPQHQQQHEWHDPFAVAPRTPSFDRASTSSSSFDHGHSQTERVRALVAHGGSFRHVGLGGMWEYVGGAQKLVGVPRTAGISQLLGQLGSQAHAAPGQCKIKYALPGSTGATTYVDLETQEDVENMWDEWDDYTSSHKGTACKLQLYVEASGSSGGSRTASAYCSSDSGRGSGGSDASCRSGMAGLGGKVATALAGAGSNSSLQPDTPAHASRAGSSSLSAAAAAAALTAVQASVMQDGSPAAAAGAAVGSIASRFAGMNLLKSSMSAPADSSSLSGAAALASGAGQSEQAEKGRITLVPFFSAQLPAQASSSNTAEEDEEEEQFVTCFDTAALHAAANNAAAAAGVVSSSAALPSQQAAVVVAGASTSSSAGAASAASSMLSSQSGHVQSGGGVAAPAVLQPLDVAVRQKRDQLKQLVADLEGRVEVIMPWELNVVRYIGGGAFGEVYLSRWHGTEVAVKCLSPSLITADRGSSSTPCADAMAELLKEAGMLACLHHPNIVAVFGVVLPPMEFITTQSSKAPQQLAAGDADADADDLVAAAAGYGSSAAATSHSASTAFGVSSSAGQAASDCSAAVSMMSRAALIEGHPPAPAVVTEYLSAGSLRSAISSRAEWLKSSMAKAKLLLDTARGLDYLHSKRLVHFDLKSANLLVTMKDKVPCVKVADFGLTKQRRQTFVTGVTSLRGTLPWIAPEIVKQPESVTEAADIYSFGVIMWELWTYQEPFEGVHLHALLHQLASPQGLSLPVPGTADWGDEESPQEPAPGYSQLMQQCWRPPAERPSSRQVVAALDAMMEALRDIRKQRVGSGAAGAAAAAAAAASAGLHS